MTAGISKKTMTVQTTNSTYRFGEADENGVRSISRVGKSFPVDRCRILGLYKGKGMIFESADPKIVKKWTSTEVKSIIVD